MSFVLSFAYHIGITSCAIQGAEKGKGDLYPPIHRYVLNSFGGGTDTRLYFGCTTLAFYKRSVA